MRLTKDSKPEGITVPMTIVDAIPVVFFGINCILLGRLFHSPLFVLGAILCLIGGALKVLWKLIVAVKEENVWPLFLQMRITMPIGFVLMLLAVILKHKELSISAIFATICSLPGGIFIAIGLLGMVCMTVFAFALDNSDPKANWIEQITNGISQGAFFIGILCFVLA